MRGQLFIVSAASGAGKTSLMRALVESLERLQVAVSHTTRAQRPGEVEGHDYYFVSEAAFTEMEQADAFVESAMVFSHHYGTCQETLEEKLANGIDVILEIDWQGARQIRALGLECASLFIMPPSLMALRNRLQGRAQDSQQTIESRLQKACAEHQHYPEYDYLVVNDDFERALSDLQAIIRAERLKVSRQQLANEEILGPLCGV